MSGLYRKATKEEVGTYEAGALALMVMPVTLDYEAARRAAPEGGDLMSDEEIQAIVDAALGEEEQ